MPKVFIPNRGGHDYSEAAEWGDVVFCTQGVVPKFNPSHMVRVLQEFIDESSPDDYILLTSLPVLCCVFCGMFAAKHGRLNFLLFKDGKYIERKLDFDQQYEG